MERLRHRIGHAFLIFSLLLNLVGLTLLGVIWKTNLLDAPLLSLVVSKNCQSGELLNAEDSAVGQRLLDLVCDLSSEGGLPSE